jgi:hypothetical protein
LPRLPAGTEHYVNHNLGRKLRNLVAQFRQAIAVPMNALHAAWKVRLRVPAMQHRNLVTSSVELTHHGRPNEPAPANHQYLQNQSPTTKL